MDKRFQFVYWRFLQRIGLLIVLALLSLLDLTPLPHDFSAAAIPVLSQVHSAHAQAALQETDARTATSSAAYEFTVVAKTGQAGLIGFGSKAGEELVSINDAGMVAFIGRSSGNKQAVYVGNGSADPALISLAPDSIRTYGPGLAIDNLGQVMVIDQDIYAGVNRTQLRRWVPGIQGAIPLVSGKATVTEDECPTAFPNACPYQYSNLYGYLTVNNLDQIAFMAQELRNPTRRFLVTYAPFKEYSYNVAPSPRPVFADDGYLVFRNDNNSSQSIVRRKADLSDTSILASAPNFSSLGLSPGVSDDGSIIAFYGELTQIGASTLKLTPGPGIFASIKTNNGGRVLRRVAGVAGNSYWDPGETFVDSNGNKKFDSGESDQGKIARFEPDTRISVNDARKIAYIAFDSANQKGIYTSQVAFFSVDPSDPNAFAVPNPPALVVKQGMLIAGLGTVQNINVYDSLNRNGLVAFWVSTSTGSQGVIRAKWQCPERDYTDRSSAPYINQYNAGEALGLPFNHNKRGGNACGPSSFTMLINSIMFAKGKSERLDLTNIFTTTINGDNNFDPVKTKAILKSLGYSLPPLLFGKDKIDAKLNEGIPLLVSTRFGSRAQPNWGGGHVILLLGKTTKGDYVVSDPAGDYFASPTGHYGADKCGGDYIIYPNNTILSKALLRNDSAKRWALPITPYLGTDPEVLLIIGHFSGSGPSPFQLWLEDESGKRTGFLTNGNVLEEIPDSSAEVDPQEPSDPDSLPEDEIDPLRWPYSVMVTTPDASLRAFVYGNRNSSYSLEILRYLNGNLIENNIVSGTLAVGETKPITITSTNIAPAANNDIITTTENISVTTNVLANDTDANSDVLSVITITQASNGYSVNNGNGSITYMPNHSFTGIDSFTYTINDGRDGTATATVTVNVNLNSSTLQVFSNSLSFTATQGDSNPAAQPLTLNHTGSTSLTWTATFSPTWLNLSKTSGATPATLDVSVDSAGLAVGSHQGEIRITGGGQANPLIVPVTLVVNPAGGNSLLHVDAAELNYSAIVGNGNPAAQVLAINSSGTPLWDAIVSSSWIKLSATEGAGAANVQVTVDTANLALGNHTGQITILSDVLDEPIVIDVSVTLVTLALQVSPQTLVFSAVAAGANPLPQSFTITSNTDLTWTADEELPWLDLSQQSGTTPATISATIKNSGLPAGIYKGNILVSGSGVASQTIAVTLNILPENSNSQLQVYLPLVTR